MDTNLENAERVVTAALSVEERIEKCILVTLIEQNCGVSRRVAKNLLMRLVSKGIYTDLYYHLTLPQEAKKATPPHAEKKEDKEEIDNTHIKIITSLSILFYPLLLLAFLIVGLVSSHYSGSLFTLNGCFNG